MGIIKVNDRTPMVIQQLLAIWESAVKATHLFLSEGERIRIKEYIPQGLKVIPHLLVAEDEQGVLVAFMGIDEHKLEMLFVSDEERGKGLGKQLMQYGMERYGINALTVNEQNPLAQGFYEHMGFEVYKRTDNDQQGNPYPLLYMTLK